MINDNDIPQIDEDLVSEEDTLLFSTFPGPRLFILNNSSQTNLLGVLLEENDDSFLVGLLSRLLEVDEGTRIEPFIKVPYLRLMKNSVMTVLFLFGIFKEKYIPYLIEEGEALYPELTDLIEDLREQNPPEIPESPKQDSQTEGMNDEQLKEYLTEKAYRGEIIYGTGTTKH